MLLKLFCLLLLVPCCLLLQKAGVHMKGFAPSLDMMLDYRVLLAPLRYGAGLKGKVSGLACPPASSPIGRSVSRLSCVSCVGWELGMPQQGCPDAYMLPGCR